VNYPEGWRLRAKLPINPNCREILGFRYSKRTELLSYAIGVYKRLLALDRAVANAVMKLYKTNLFPVRRDALFFVGRRNRGGLSGGS
jgi:hypothetical protein